MSRVEITDLAVAPASSGAVTRLSCRVSGATLPEELWFEASGDAPTALSDRGNWAAVALLYPAMWLGSDLHVDATLSPQLLDAINHELQAFLVIYDPELRRIRVTCRDERADGAPGSLVATGFSAGIDSFATLAHYRLARVHPSLAVSALSVFDVGTFAWEGEPAFTRAVNRCAAFAAPRGLHTLFLRSNLDSFYREPAVRLLKFERTNTLRNVAAALALEGGVGRYYYSSTFAPREIGVRATYNTAYLDPILLPLLSTERLRFVSACADLTRIEKTRLVADLAAAHALLDVCTRPWQRVPGGPLNCSRCGKCARTMFALEALGRIGDFTEAFDVSLFRRERDQLRQELESRAAGGNALDAEVVTLLGGPGSPSPPPPPPPPPPAPPPRTRRWRWF